MSNILKQSEEWAKALMEDNVKKNTVTASEFSKFLPLYDRTVADAMVMDKQQILRLTTEFAARFIINYPVTITDESGQVIKVVPPVQRSDLPDIGKTPLGAAILNRYNDALRNPHMPPHEVQQAQNMFTKMVTLACSQVKQEAEEAKNTPSTHNNKSTDDWEWE